MLNEARIFEAEIIDISKNIVDLQFSEARFFESGDVIGYLVEGRAKILGTVLDAQDDILSVYLTVEDL